VDEYLQSLKRQAQADPGNEAAQTRYIRAFHRSFGHFPQCDQLKYAESDLTSIAAYEKAVDDYEARWPKYCRKCGGWGGKLGYDSSTGMEDYDPCQACIELGYCPQCGEATAEMLEEPGEGYYDYFACSLCGWRDDDPNREGHPMDSPQVTDCNCWELEYFKGLLEFR
jgi:hypothetical protein